MSPDQARLWNPDRRGTLIVGDPRTGTHFLQRIVRDRVADHRGVQVNHEIDLAPIRGWPRSVRTVLEQLASQDSYQIAIINSATAKVELISDPAALERWHVIRLTRQDKVSWFRSWALFFLHGRSEVNAAAPATGQDDRLLHHGTPEASYREGLARHGPVMIDSRAVDEACGSLCLHVLAKLIAVDEEIDYEDLPGLQSEHTWWKGNEYPDITMQDMFVNWQEMRPVLEHWHKIDRPGLFR